MTVIRCAFMHEHTWYLHEVRGKQWTLVLSFPEFPGWTLHHQAWHQSLNQLSHIVGPKWNLSSIQRTECLAKILH